MSEYFPPSRRRFRGDIKVKLDLSNYATKTDLKKCDTCRCQKFCIKNKSS